jgi:5-methylcytosine-specific restriction endonuclease McrA/predicted transcriptional regulator
MKEKIIELRRRGYTVNQIVVEIGCAKSTVSYHINKANLGGSKNNFLYGISDDTVEEIKLLRLSGKTYEEILELVVISKDKLIKICRVIDLNFNINNLKAHQLNTDDVVKYYLNCKSKKKTGEFFNVSKDTIRKIVGDKTIKKTRQSTPSQNVIQWRKRKKIELVKYKGGKCERCGYDKTYEALQFHHINPSEKDFTISGKSYSLERLKKEVDKCIMVCANCHIEIHEELRK